jgi:hypothetical protein
MIVRVVIDQLGYVNGFILTGALGNRGPKPPRFSIGVIWPGNPSKPFDLPNKDLADLMKDAKYVTPEGGKRKSK